MNLVLILLKIADLKRLVSGQVLVWLIMKDTMKSFEQKGSFKTDNTTD